ncbi:MAG: carbohydrate ABC transporter permease, partial [Rhizobium sp.]
MAMVSKRRVFLERTTILTITVLFLLPVCWLISTAYKPSNQIFSVPPRLFFEPTLDQFRKAFAAFDVFSLVRSSLVISIGTTLLSLLLGTPAGYALARSKSRYAAGFAYFFLAIRMIPAIAALIPFY